MLLDQSEQRKGINTEEKEKVVAAGFGMYVQ